MIGLNEAFFSAPEPQLKCAVVGDLCQLVEAVFRSDGHLQSGIGLHFRPQQYQMAQHTATTWLQEQALLFEAGTGVGKSLAYLIPGILHACLSERQMVVSTHTIALQEQIETEDLGICRRLFHAVPALRPFADFRHAVMLGRGNYLCGTRLQQAIRAKSELFPSAEQVELQRIANWAQITETGLRMDLRPQPLPKVWEWVMADGHACNPRNCNPRNCFYRRAREAIRSANLVIINHSLLFALLSAGLFPRGDTPGILFPHDFVVLDEAHTLPAIATEYFGLNLSETGLQRQLHKLYQFHKNTARGLLVRHGHPPLRKAVTRLQVLADHLFAEIREAFLSQGRPFRLKQPDWIENSLDSPLSELLHGLEKIESRMEEGPERDELEGARRQLQGYREGLLHAIALADPDAVYWLECGSVKQTLIRSAPLDVAPALRERLFDRPTGLLLTSATLAEGNTMDSFKRKVGADDAAAVQVASPFDYPLQMQILIHGSAPTPSSANTQLDCKFLAAEIHRLAGQISGGTLALFTSYRDMQAVFALLQAAMRGEQRTLLCQGAGLSRRDLVRQMKSTGNALLLGTDSFWTGVDIPGAALSQVIITRLPFENPTHPVAEARAEWCRAKGAIPFNEITLPAALVKFRQGIGRLIRNHSDEGRLVILDSRILGKPYGRLFLDVLPHPSFNRIGDIS